MDTYEEIPFDALTYLTGECNYGGRVTDNHDRRLLIALLNTYYSAQVVTDRDYKFCSAPEYYAPRDLTYDEYVEFIRNLPLITSPEALGLHENANTTRSYQESLQMFNGILLTLPRQVIKLNADKLT